MPAIIFKAPSCYLKTTDKGKFLLKGNYEINIVDEATLKDLKKCNPEFDVWVQKGYLTINEKEDNVKADGLLMQEKAAEQKLKDAEKQAKEIVDAAYEEAERIRKEATSITVTGQQGEAVSQPEQQQQQEQQEQQVAQPAEQQQSQTEEKTGKKK